MTTENAGEHPSHPLALHLAVTVPLRIDDLGKRGGPLQSDWDRIRSYSSEIGERGDVLLYGAKKGEAAALANKLADALAVMAFVRGGVDFFGMTFAAFEDELYGRRPANAPVAASREAWEVA